MRIWRRYAVWKYWKKKRRDDQYLRQEKINKKQLIKTLFMKIFYTRRCN